MLSSSLLWWHDKLCDIYSKQCEVLVHVNVTLCLSIACDACLLHAMHCLLHLLHAMHCLLHFHVFIHMHLASHLGMLYEPREGCDVESKPKTVFGGSIPKMEGLSKC